MEIMKVLQFGTPLSFCFMVCEAGSVLDSNKAFTEAPLAESDGLIFQVKSLS